MLEMRTGTSTSGPNFTTAKRLEHSGKSMYDAAAPCSHDNTVLPQDY